MSWSHLRLYSLLINGCIRILILGQALSYILQNNFQSNVGLRPNSKKVAVVITDGKSEDDPSVSAQNLRDSGVEVYAIGGS